MNRSLSLAATTYLVLLALGAVGACAVLLADAGMPTGPETGLALALAGALAWAYRHPLAFGHHTRLQLDTAVVLAAALLLPPELVTLLAGLAPLLANMPRREEWSQAIFNCAQLALQGAVGGLLLASAGWQRSDPFADLATAPAVVGAALSMHLINTVAVAGMVALQEHRPFLGTWRDIAVALAPAEMIAHLAQVALAVLAAAVAHAHPWAVILLALPAIAVHRALDHHAALRLRAEARLVHQAYHDSLTDLPNRARFLERLNEALAVAAAGGPVPAVLFLDLDRFKLVNDTLGHAAGDELLIEVAQRLRSSVRPNDMVARLGGDEFTVLLAEAATPDAAEAAASRIASAVAKPIVLGDQEMVISVSVGLVCPGRDPAAAAELLRRADVALYRAKEEGRARVAVFEPAMGRATAERVSLESSLRRALELGELRLRYQPQVELATGRIIGLEALLRWEQPDHGLVLPSAFLAVAEETGLIMPIGHWILTTATTEARRWQDALPFPPTLGINISDRQLDAPGILSDVRDLLARTGLPPGGLTVEVPEPAVVRDPRRAARVLAELRELGVRVALDAAGAGLVKLARLDRLPLDALQLDRSVVAELGRTSAAAAVVRAVIGLGHELGLQVIAEGVEHADQLAFLCDAGCDAAQGDLFARPTPPDGVLQILAAGVLPAGAVPGFAAGRVSGKPEAGHFARPLGPASARRYA